MALKIIGELLLLPLRCLNAVFSPFIYPPKLGERDRQELDLRRKMGQQEMVIHGLADQNTLLQDTFQEAERRHKAEMEQKEARYQKRIKELERQLAFQRLNSGSQP